MTTPKQILTKNEPHLYSMPINIFKWTGEIEGNVSLGQPLHFYHYAMFDIYWKATTKNTTSPLIPTSSCSKNLPQICSYCTENMTLHKRM